LILAKRTSVPHDAARKATATPLSAPMVR
jgi:hypothetical protein